jgi:hypothetical protein
MNADELLLMGQADIVARLGLGTIEKWQDVLHQSAPQLVMELIRNFIPNVDYDNFLDQPMQEQIIQLREAAVSKVREVLDPIQLAQQNLLSGIS